MNIATTNEFRSSNIDSLSLATNAKPKGLIIKHMLQYLEIDQLRLDEKKQAIKELLTNFSEQGYQLKLNSNSPLKEVDLLVALDKLSLHCSLFFNIKQILTDNVNNLSHTISKELQSLKLKIEVLLLGMENSQSGFFALAGLLNHINKVLEEDNLDHTKLKEIEKQIESVIESHAFDIFQGIQNLNETGVKVRYLLSDIIFEAMTEI